MKKIKFVYSWIYDAVYEDIYKRDGNEKEYGQYPEGKEIKDYIKKVEKIWSEKELKILNKYSEITGLDWSDEEIKCYVVGWAIPFSNPLTIPMYKENEEYFVTILAHELIHNLLIQNEERPKEYWDYVDEKYKDFSLGVQAHILLHAVLKKTFMDLGYDEQLQIHRDSLYHLDDYRKSWEIIDKEGEDEIINKMKTFIKK